MVLRLPRVLAKLVHCASWNGWTVQSFPPSVVVATFGSSAGQPAASCHGAIAGGHSVGGGPDGVTGTLDVAAVNGLTAVQLEALEQDSVERDPNAPEPSNRPSCQCRPPSVLTMAKSEGNEEEDFS